MTKARNIRTLYQPKILAGILVTLFATIDPCFLYASGPGTLEPSPGHIPSQVPNSSLARIRDLSNQNDAVFDEIRRLVDCESPQVEEVFGRLRGLEIELHDGTKTFMIPNQATQPLEFTEQHLALAFGTQETLWQMDPHRQLNIPVINFIPSNRGMRLIEYTSRRENGRRGRVLHPIRSLREISGADVLQRAGNAGDRCFLQHNRLRTKRLSQEDFQQIFSSNTQALTTLRGINCNANTLPPVRILELVPSRGERRWVIPFNEANCPLFTDSLNPYTKAEVHANRAQVCGRGNALLIRPDSRDRSEFREMNFYHDLNSAHLGWDAYHLFSRLDIRSASRPIRGRDVFRSVRVGSLESISRGRSTTSQELACRIQSELNRHNVPQDAPQATGPSGTSTINN